MTSRSSLFIHRCDIRHAAGSRTRILACRENVRDRIADYDVLVIIENGPGTAKVAGRAVIQDYPRALGVEGLFSSVLANSSCENDPVDEHGNVVPMPEKTKADWVRDAELYRRMMNDCLDYVAGREEPTPPNPGRPVCPAT